MNHGTAPAQAALPVGTAGLMGFTSVAMQLGRKADRSTRIYLWRLMRRGAFPAARQVSSNRIAWDRTEVEAWQASRPPVSYARGSE